MRYFLIELVLFRTTAKSQVDNFQWVCVNSGTFNSWRDYVEDSAYTRQILEQAWGCIGRLRVGWALNAWIDWCCCHQELREIVRKNVTQRAKKSLLTFFRLWHHWKSEQAALRYSQTAQQPSAASLNSEVRYVVIYTGRIHCNQQVTFYLVD